MLVSIELPPKSHGSINALYVQKARSGDEKLTQKWAFGHHNSCALPAIINHGNNVVPFNWGVRSFQ